MNEFQKFLASLLTASKAALVELLDQKSTLLEAIYTELGDSSDANLIKSLTGTAEEKAKAFKSLNDEATAIEEELEKRNTNERRSKQNSERRAGLVDTTKTTPNKNPGNIEVSKGGFNFKNIQLPRSAKASRVKSFKSDDYGDGNQKAYAWGQLLLSCMPTNIKASQKANDLLEHWGVEKVAYEGDNDTGGSLVPEEFIPDLINLVEQYGIASQIALTVPMKRDTIKWPIKTGGLVAKPVGEGGSSTAQDNKFSRVEVIAKDWQVLNQVSIQLNEDTAVPYADIFLKEAARATAKAKDDAFFNGDGTSAYHKIVGARQKLLDAATTPAGVFVGPTGTASSYASFIMESFSSVIGVLPEFAETPDACWVVSKAFWGAIMLPILLKAGGNRDQEVMGGVRQKKEFAGYPVYISQVMPKVAAANQICALLGDFSQGAIIGDRAQFALALSDSALNSFENGMLAYRVTSRWGETIHGVGDGTDASAIVALKTAAS